jgi:predicted O-methyltransferase YrrM
MEPLSTATLVLGLAFGMNIAALIMLALRLRARFRHLDKQLTNLASRLREPILAKLEEKARELNNALALTQMGFRFPLFLSGWSIDSFVGKALVQHIMEEKPRLVLELGSGSSTLLIARSLELMDGNPCEHIAVDHEPRFLDITRRQLELNNLAHRVHFWLCPLGHVPGTDRLWYQGLAEKLEGKTIDLLLVDGPPGSLQRDSRFPALPMLARFISDRCIVILDDAAREDEQSIAKRWAASFPEFSLEIHPQGHGMALLRRVSKVGTPPEAGP